MPAPAAPVIAPPPPTPFDPSVTAARASNRAAAAMAAGRGSTILTSAQGLTDATTNVNDPTKSKKSLLGQ